MLLHNGNILIEVFIILTLFFNGTVGSLRSAFNAPQETDSGGGVRIYAQGGVAAVYAPADERILELSRLGDVKSVIERRLDNLSIPEYSVSVGADNKSVEVVIPNAAGDGSAGDGSTGAAFNSDGAFQTGLLYGLVEPPIITFRPYGQYAENEGGSPVISDVILLDGGHINSVGIKNSVSDAADEDELRSVSIKFDEEGARLFEAATRNYLNKSVAIYADDILLSASTVQAVITDGETIITGMSQKTAESIAAVLRAGVWPVELNLVGLRIY